MADLTPNLKEWLFVKERGAIARTGEVYRSPDGQFYLRTGEINAIRAEAEFCRETKMQGFPIPDVTEIGQFPGGIGYFIETSVGTESFGDLLGREYAAAGKVSDETFDAFCKIVLRFLSVQIKPACRQSGPSQLRDGIQFANVLHQNPDVGGLLDQAITKAEDRTRALPLVLTHGDLSPFNILPGGIIDFEERFVAPAGLDAITSVVFQRLWDHPMQDGTGTMLLWDFSRRQIAHFLAQADTLYASEGLPLLSNYFDDFLMLKAIWALCFERPEDEDNPQAQRWRWRRRVAAYCAERTLASTPINSDAFRVIGLGRADLEHDL